MIHSAIPAIKMCEMLGNVGGHEAHQMETRIMEAAENVAQMTRTVLQELTTAAEPRLLSRRFVKVKGRKDEHQRGAHNGAKQRELRLAELARRAPMKTTGGNLRGDRTCPRRWRQLLASRRGHDFLRSCSY